MRGTGEGEGYRWEGKPGVSPTVLRDSCPSGAEVPAGLISPFQHFSFFSVSSFFSSNIFNYSCISFLFLYSFSYRFHFSAFLSFFLRFFLCFIFLLCISIMFPLFPEFKPRKPFGSPPALFLCWQSAPPTKKNNCFYELSPVWTDSPGVGCFVAGVPHVLFCEQRGGPLKELWSFFRTVSHQDLFTVPHRPAASLRSTCYICTASKPPNNCSPSFHPSGCFCYCTLKTGNDNKLCSDWLSCTETHPDSSQGLNRKKTMKMIWARLNSTEQALLWLVTSVFYSWIVYKGWTEV